MATLISVNVGTPRDVAWNNRTVYTGAWKQPVAGPRMVRRLNVDGDGQGDLGGHGGENRAVLVYQIESYRHWASEFNRDDLLPGYLGENFTVDGLPDDEVCIGDRYQIGEAIFEVTQPRVTCYRAGMRIGEPRMAALLVSHRRPGFYCRVIAEGEVAAGQEIVKIASGPEQVTVAEIDALLYLPGHARDGLERALRIPALSPGWKASLQSLADQNGGAATSSGNTGLTAAASSPPPSWPGFRPLRVTAVHDESRAVRSVSLADPDGVMLPEWLPGQSITLRLHPEYSEAALIRNYSLSNRPGSDDYRISVKREPHGAAERIHPRPREGWRSDRRGRTAGDVLPHRQRGAGHPAVRRRRSHPRALDAACACQGADRLARSGGCTAPATADEHPFAAESRALLDRLPNSRSRVYYSRPGSADRQGVDFTAEGRLSIGTRTRPAVRRGGLPVWPGFLHERSQCRARDLRPGVRAHPHGNIRRHSSTHTRYRRDVGAAAPAAGTTRPGARGPVRAQRHLGAVGTAIREPARVRRSMRRSDSMVLPDRGLSQLRNRTARRSCPLRPAAAGTSGAGKHPDLLRATHRGGGRRPLSAAPG